MNGDEFLGNTNPGDVSIDTANSEEMMTGSHITKQHTYKYQGPVRYHMISLIITS